MNRRDFLTRGGLGLASLASLNAAPSTGAKRRPNLLVITTDQQHPEAVSAFGNPWLHTPAMDRLAARGVRFSRNYCPNPVCGPARGAWISGRMPSENRAFKNGLWVREDIPTVGEWFREYSDYETIHVGKWHLPYSYTDNIRGFRVLHSGYGGPGRQSDSAASLATESFLRDRKPSDRPFLLFCNFLQPHDICEWLRLNQTRHERLPHPEIAGELPQLPENFHYDPREPERIRSRRSNNEPAKGEWDERHWRYYLWAYYRHVEIVDAEIGRVLDALDESGLAGETVVLFTSDHGEGLGHHQFVRKDNPYDAAARVPAILSAPGHLPEGKTSRALSGGIDLFPTLCDFAGIAPPPKMRGRSMRPLAEDPNLGGADFIPVEIVSNHGQMIRTDRYKYVTYLNDPVEQLFDMETDPLETRNLAAEAPHAATVREHRNLLMDWRRGLEIDDWVPQENRFEL